MTTANHKNKNYINSIHVLWYTTCSDQNAIIKNCYGEYITKLLLFLETLNYISVKAFYILFTGFLSYHTVMPRDWFRCTLLSWLQRLESWTDWQNKLRNHYRCQGYHYYVVLYLKETYLQYKNISLTNHIKLTKHLNIKCFTILDCW